MRRRRRMMIQTQSHGVQHAHTIFTAMFVGIRTHVMNIRCKEGMSERMHRPVTVTYTTSRLRRITPKNPHEITAYHAYMVCYNLLVCKKSLELRITVLVTWLIYTYTVTLIYKNALITITCSKRSSVVCLCFCRLRRRRTGIDLPLRGFFVYPQCNSDGFENSGKMEANELICAQIICFSKYMYIL